MLGVLTLSLHSEKMLLSTSALQLAINKYSAAVDAAQGETEPTVAALNNRAAAHLRLGNYGHALTDAKRAGELDPCNVKAHFRYVRSFQRIPFYFISTLHQFTDFFKYRAAVAATNTERITVAQSEIEAGLKACKEGYGKNEDVASLKRQQELLHDVVRRIEVRDKKQKERKSRVTEVKDMLAMRGIRMGNAEYAQQHEYKVTTPQFIDEEWCWPVLLVYATQNFGEQSDYLECVGESVTMRELIETVFGDGTETPWWDVDRIYRSQYSMKIRFRRRKALVDTSRNCETEEDYKWHGVEEDTEWGDIDMNDSIANLLTRKDYVLPLYPVIHITGYDDKA